MENQLFNFDNNEIKVLLDDDENPWFIAHEICQILEIMNSRDTVAKRVSPADKQTVDISDGLSRNPKRTIINEFGLYDLVLVSRTHKAKKFKHWLTHEVIPQIRKTGSYNPQLPTDPKAQALLLAQQLISANEQVKELESHLIEAAPKVEFHDTMVATDDWITLRKFGIASGIGAKNIFAFLSEQKVLYRSSGSLVPYDYYVKRGWLQLKEYMFPDHSGKQRMGIEVYVSAKGEAGILGLRSKGLQLELGN